MRLRTLLIIGLFALVIGLTYWLSPVVVPEVTRDDVVIFSETDTEVGVSYDGNSGTLYKYFKDDFSEPNFFNWFGDGRWTTITLLSPSAPTVAAYAALRTQIFAGTADFLDNRIDALNGYAQFRTIAPDANMVTSKAHLEHNLLWFTQGDDLWFQADYLLVEGIPFTITDFQERGRHNSPGPRITIWNGTHIGMEMKHGLKPDLRQDTHPVPVGDWFTLKLHMTLDHKEGWVKLWQDGILIIDAPMRTLAAENSLLNALEVGITATDQKAEVWIDNVEISQHPL